MPIHGIVRRRIFLSQRRISLLSRPLSSLGCPSMGWYDVVVSLSWRIISEDSWWWCDWIKGLLTFEMWEGRYLLLPLFLHRRLESGRVAVVPSPCAAATSVLVPLFFLSVVSIGFLLSFSQGRRDLFQRCSSASLPTCTCSP